LSGIPVFFKLSEVLAKSLFPDEPVTSPKLYQFVHLPVCLSTDKYYSPQSEAYSYQSRYWFQRGTIPG